MSIGFCYPPCLNKIKYLQNTTDITVIAVITFDKIFSRECWYHSYGSMIFLPDCIVHFNAEVDLYGTHKVNTNKT